MRRLLAFVAVAACVLGPAAARAQSLGAGAAPGAKAEGDGIKLGDRLVLHLGIGAELRYDSNVFYENTNLTQGLALRLTPGFAISTRSGQRTTNPDGSISPNKVEFHLGAGLDYREWVYSNTGVRPPRQFNVVANFGLTLFPSGPVTAEIYDNYLRSTQPAYTAVNYNLDRDVNEVGLRLRIKPGGGRLELQLGYGFGIDLWEVAPLQPYDNFYHHATIRLLWKFLPKTSVYIQGEEYAYQYRNPGAVFRPDGYPLRVIAGLNGLLTAKLAFDIYGGYANGFYQGGPSPNTGIAGLSLTWRPFSLGTLTLAYRHDILNSLLGVYADIDNVQASWAQQIWRFMGYLRLAYQNTRYKGIVPTGGVTMPSDTERTDNGFTFNARVDYFAYKSWLALSLGYDLNLVRADHEIPLGPGLGTQSADFTKHEVFLSLSIFY
jgi:hypothetical protein